jgi:hypothetical protein
MGQTSCANFIATAVGFPHMAAEGTFLFAFFQKVYNKITRFLLDYTEH